MHRSERGPAERRALMGRIPARRAARRRARGGAQPSARCPPSRRHGAPSRRRRPGAAGSNPRREHQVGRVEPLVENRVRQVTVILACQRREERRILGEHRRSRCARPRPAAALMNRTRAGLRADEQIVDIAMPELQRDVVRRHAEAERPAVDVERRNGRIAGLVDASGDAGGIRVEQARCESRRRRGGPP